MRQPSDLFQTFHLHSFLWPNQRFPTRCADSTETAPFGRDLPCHPPAWAGLPMCPWPCLIDVFKPQRLLPPQHLKTRASCPGSARCFAHAAAGSAHTRARQPTCTDSAGNAAVMDTGLRPPVLKEDSPSQEILQSES